MDHLLSKDSLEIPARGGPNRGHPTRRSGGRIGTVPIPRACPAGSPRGSTVTAAIEPQPTGPIDRRDRDRAESSRPRWVRGGAVLRAASPPGQRPVGTGAGATDWRCHVPGRAVGVPLLSDNSVVGHASKSTKQVVVVALSFLHEQWTLTDPSESPGDRYPKGGRRVARRRGAAADRGRARRVGRDVAGSSSDRGRARRPDRRGQAPKGTGGMPRRHQQYGRGRLRKVRGSCPTSVDPGMPAETRGTETSQYPEEKKATATPSVAASERGPA